VVGRCRNCGQRAPRESLRAASVQGTKIPDPDEVPDQ
jgi:hypothetical protein